MCLGWARALAELRWLAGRLDWAGRVIWLVGWHGGGLAGGTQFYRWLYPVEGGVAGLGG